MPETMLLWISLPAGVFFGALFFGGLWWTVQKGVTCKRPARWFLGSMLLRLTLVLTGFYFIADGHWPRLLVCLVGFFMARHLVLRLTRGKTKPAGLTREVHHAA